MTGGSSGWSTTCSTSSAASLTTSCFGDRCKPRLTMPRQSRRTIRKPSFASPFVTNAYRRREDRATGPRRAFTVPTGRSADHRFDPEGTVGNCRRRRTICNTPRTAMLAMPSAGAQRLV
jgi:hypothetical protein